MLEVLFETHTELVAEYTQTFKRYLYKEINWQARAIAVLGARGVGKTTMLLQYERENFADPTKCLYLLGDDLAVLQLGLSAVAREFTLKGGKVLIIDEVHKYPNWSQEVKNIYDKHPHLRLILSGSSNVSIAKEKYDLSRRVISYRLYGFSFREFLNLELGLSLVSYKLETLLKDHAHIAEKLKKQLKHMGKGTILEYFSQYLEHGYYPYYREGVADFSSRLENVLDKVFHEDIASVHDLNHSSVTMLKKVMTLVGSSHPLVVDIASMARNLNISRATLYHYLEYLVEAELLIEGKAAASGNKLVRKPVKLYLNNPNLYAVVGKMMSFASRKGAVRESFAFNQLTQSHRINIPHKGDLFVDGKYLFEIGGRAKGFSQVVAGSNGYVFSDNLEIGFSNKLPLYSLGFLY